MTETTMNFDGAITKNPGGDVGYGYAIYEDGEIIATGSGYDPNYETSNEAEYLGLISGLEMAIELGLHGQKLTVFGDSQLVISQMNGEYKVKAENLKPLYWQATALARQFRVRFEWVPRDLNDYADQLSKEAIG